jgi:predicted N-formylglutamate amidohydrolase
MAETMSLLAGADPAPVIIRNPGARSPFLLLSDHSGRLVPRLLGDLGVPAAEMDRHIAWDIGIDAVGERLAAALDATMIAQAYSRLVIDCNRRPGHATSIPAVSDGTVVPGNAKLDEAETAARVREIFAPYHGAIAAELDRRAGGAVAVVALHSFTPMLRMDGVARPWPVGVLYDRDAGFALAVMAALRARGYLVGDNEPYRLSDDSDYSVVVHAEGRGLPYVELEIRQDLIADAAGQAAWADVLAAVLPEAWAAYTA